MVLRRAVKVSLQWVAIRDGRRLAALLQAYRAAVNFFVGILWREPTAGFSTATSKRLERTRLSARYRDQALKQAVEVVSSTRKSARELGVDPARPFFRGMAILDAKFVRFERAEGEHDLVISLACLNKGHPLRIRTKKTRMVKKWLARPGARLVAGCGLTDGDLLTLWVELPAPVIRTEGRVLGVDVGVSKLLATSDGEFLGTDFRVVSVPAWGNSITCPRCRHRDKANRSGDVFRCVVCGLLDDADHVGAVAAQTHGERLFADALVVSERERYLAEAKIEQRKAAAQRRGQVTAEKWRRRRAQAASGAARAEGNSASGDSMTNSSSRGAQSPAARTPRGSSPIRDQTCGGAPEKARAGARAEENPEGGRPRAGRPEATGRHGEEPRDADVRLDPGATAKLRRSRVLALDEFSDKP